MGPGRVSWKLSLMLMERWKLFLQSLLRTKDKSIRKRNQEPCVKPLQSWRASLHHGGDCGGGTEAGKGRLSSPAFAISLRTNTGDGLPEVPIKVGAVRPQESPGLEVCEIPQIARF